MIVTMVKPKAGRLASGGYTEVSPIKGSVFGNRPREYVSLSGSGGLKMDNDRAATIYPGALSDYHNTATQEDRPAITADLVPVALAPNIQPQERGTFFRRKIFAEDNMKFGGSKSDPSDTAFHSLKEVELANTKPRSAVDGAHVSTASFPSLQNIWQDPHNSFVQNRPTAANPSRLGSGRWTVVKRGVV